MAEYYAILYLLSKYGRCRSAGTCILVLYLCYTIIQLGITVFPALPAVEDGFAGEQFCEDAADCPDVDGLGVVTGS